MLTKLSMCGAGRTSAETIVESIGLLDMIKLDSNHISWEIIATVIFSYKEWPMNLPFYYFLMNKNVRKWAKETSSETKTLFITKTECKVLLYNLLNGKTYCTGSDSLY